MANKEVKIGDDWYLGENNDGDLIFYNVRKNEAVKEIDVITGAEDKKGNLVNNVLSSTVTHNYTKSRAFDAIVWKDGSGTIHADGETGEIASGSDAATVIQAAIDNAESILIKQDYYTISSTLNLNSKTRIEGERHRGTRLQLADGANCDMWNININYYTFRDIRFDGNSANQTATSHGWVLKTDSLNSQIENVNIVDFNGDGMRIENQLHAHTIFNFYSENNVGDGFHLTTDTGAELRSSLILSSYFQSNGGKGINLENTTNRSLFLKGTAMLNTEQGIFADGSSAGIGFKSMRVLDNGGHGIESDMPNTRIEDCLVQNNGQTGIYITWDAEDSSIRGNAVNNNNQASGGWDGLRFKGSGRVANNLVRGTSHDDALVFGRRARYSNNIDIDNQGAWYGDGVVRNGKALNISLDMGGTDGEASITYKDAYEYHVLIDAGGAAVNLQGIIGVVSQDVEMRPVVILEHTGGETITCVHNSAGSNKELLNQSAADITLDANGEMVAYQFDKANLAWREMWHNLQ